MPVGGLLICILATLYRYPFGSCIFKCVHLCLGALPRRIAEPALTTLVGISTQLTRCNRSRLFTNLPDSYMQADGQDYSGQQQARRKVIPVTVSGSGQPQVQFQLPDEPPVNRRPSSASARSSSKDDNRNTMGRSPGSRAPVSRASVSPLPGRGSKKG